MTMEYAEMSGEVKLQLKDNGPLLVHGPVQLVDGEGNAFTLPPDKPIIAICRCSHSQKSPFCDGQHKQCGFEAAERASSCPE